MSDTARFQPRPGSSVVYGPFIVGYLDRHPFFRLDSPSMRWLISPRHRPATDWIFYLFVCCFFYVGFVRIAFSRYVEDLFLVFRNVVYRQSQLRDQIAQHALPSLLLNAFFCVSGGIFLFFLWRPDRSSLALSPLRSIVLLVAMLSSIYLVKYFLLTLVGWLSGRKSEAASYAFIVFMVNKVAGLLLLPFSLLLAYRGDTDHTYMDTWAWTMVCVFFLVRLARTVEFANKQMKINLLHFVFLIFAFELLPVMLIGKALGDLFL